MAISSKVPGYLKHPSGKYARCKINGKMHSLGRFGSAESRARYERLIADYLASGRSPTFGIEAGEELILADLMLRYLRHCEEYYPKAFNSEPTHTKSILRVLVALYPDLPAATFGIVEYKSIRTYVMEHKDWSRPYINKQMQRLVRMFSWAAADGLLPGSIYQDIK